MNGLNMDTNNLILTGIIFTICFLPLAIIQLNKLRKNNVLIKSVKNLSKENNCNINQYEQCSDFIIAIDEEKKCLFFKKKNKSNELTEFIKLSDYSNCKKNSRLFTSKDKNDNPTSYDIIELIFSPKTKNVEEKKIEIYNESVDITLTGEIQFLEKWLKIINKNI